MLSRLLRLGLLSLLFLHQTRPELSIKESVKELIVERPGTYDSFTVYMKPNRTCGVVGSDLDTFCNTLGAFLLEKTLDRSSCKCQCFTYQPFTFLSSIQRCAHNVTQVQDFGGELIISIHQIALSLCCSEFSQMKHGRGILKNAEWLWMKFGD